MRMRVATLISCVMLMAAACKKAEREQPPQGPGSAIGSGLATVAAPAGFAYAAGAYEIDPVHTSVVFRIKHFGVSYFHGRFNKTTGSLTLDGKDPAASTISIVVDAASVFTAEKKRDTHLASPDFFDVMQFPTIKFQSTAVKATEGGYEVTGDLELHGVKKPVTVPMTHTGSGKDPMGGFRTGFEGTFLIKRSEYGMTFMLDGLGDEVELTVAIEAIRK